MNLFPLLNLEPIVQVGDKTRLNGFKSFIAPSGTFDQVLVKPIASGAFISVSTDDKWLDWVFSASGVYPITLMIVSGAASADVEKNISVITAEQDHLFSTDEDLRL